MNPSNQDHGKTNQETQAFDPPLIHEEEVLHSIPDDDHETAEKNEPAEEGKDQEKTELITKEAMLRVTGGQL
jgi:hypothetical protein